METIGYSFRCRSALDGAPIVVIFTGFRRPSHNEKTGAMIQTWILREDVSPMWALRSGADYSICGDCRQRPFCGGKCYVSVGRAPTQVFKCYLRGRYAPLDIHRIPEAFRGRILRIGSYGDPAMVPAHLWRTLIAHGHLAGWTGYTHQWRRFRGWLLHDLLMASVDTPAEFTEAAAMGFKCFRTRRCGEPTLPGEIICPASAEAGHRTTCSQCGACNGRRGHRVIQLHGFRAGREALMA